MRFPPPSPLSFALPSTWPARALPSAAVATLAALAAFAMAMAVGRDSHTLVLLLVAPLLEELVFRAGLHEALLRRRAERSTSAASWWPNLTTALLFAAAHLALRPGLAGALTVLPALAIGACYERQRRVTPCIALHATFNGIWLLAA